MITYGLAPEAHERYRQSLHQIAARPAVKRVCDVGGGANPVLSAEFVAAHGLTYHVLDISAEELAKAPRDYVKIEADIAAPDFRLPHTYDLVFSKFVAEHVADGRRFHRNVWNMLAEGGHVLHLFPTLYALPYLVNLALPEALTQRLLGFFNPRDRYQHDKFPAYYRWCRGPTARQVGRLENIGYEIVEYGGYFGSPNYFAKVPFLKKLDRQLSAWLVEHPAPQFTSFACVHLRRPAASWGRRL